jgi:hypothetical protein
MRIAPGRKTGSPWHVRRMLLNPGWLFGAFKPEEAVARLSPLPSMSKAADYVSVPSAASVPNSAGDVISSRSRLSEGLIRRCGTPAPDYSYQSPERPLICIKSGSSCVGKSSRPMLNHWANIPQRRPRALTAKSPHAGYLPGENAWSHSRRPPKQMIAATIIQERNRLHRPKIN